MPTLAATLDEVRKRISKLGSKGLNEQNTKATLIEPVLRALGWDVEDIEEVVREYRRSSKDKPVDYGLLALRMPKLFVEAKGLGENLDDRRWANQIMGYAAVAGVAWIVLTDGDEYRIYNAQAPVPVEEKLFRTLRVSEGSQVLEQTLALLAKGELAENRIDVLWRAQFVDRQVKDALDQLFSAENDMLLVNYVAGKVKSLTADEVRASIARCKVGFDFPVHITPPTLPEKIRAKTDPAKRENPSNPTGVNVQSLLAAGLLSPPVSLFREYREQTLRAVRIKIVAG
jgi:hypothetical protein